MKVLRATSESELGPILDYVHDRKYDIDRVLLDVAKQELQIPVYLGSRQCEGILLIRGASKFQVTDRARIGEGDISTIRRKEGNVEIDGGFPVKITIAVDRFDIELTFPENAPPA